jgi:di/tricarboxylate transporter
MPILLLIVFLLLVVLLATTWISRGNPAKSAFILISLSLAALCLLGAWYAWAEPPRSIPWTTGYLLCSVLVGTLAFLRYQRP